MTRPIHPTASAYPPKGGTYATSDDDVSDTHACPMCGQHGLLRIRRRLVDRILNLFVRQRRYRCTQPGCQWQGNLRKRSRTRTRGHETERPPS